MQSPAYSVRTKKLRYTNVYVQRCYRYFNGMRMHVFITRPYDSERILL